MKYHKISRVPMDECTAEQKIAHISAGGNIRLYVAEDHIPAAEMEEIKAMANRDRAEFMARFESLTMFGQYEEILNHVPFQKFMEYTGDRRLLSEKLPAMREYYYTIA